MNASSISELNRINPTGLLRVLTRFNLNVPGISASDIAVVAQANEGFRIELETLMKSAGMSGLPQQSTLEEVNSNTPANFIGASPEQAEKQRLFGISRPLAIMLFFSLLLLGIFALIRRQ